MTLIIAGDKEFKGFCPVCGLPLMPDGCCKKYHVKKLPKRERFSGKSKSKNAFNDYN